MSVSSSILIALQLLVVAISTILSISTYINFRRSTRLRKAVEAKTLSPCPFCTVDAYRAMSSKRMKYYVRFTGQDWKVYASSGKVEADYLLFKRCPECGRRVKLK